MTEEQGPSFVEKAKNLANFSWDIINYVHQNGPAALTVSDEVYIKRYAICKECPRMNQRREECLECGCHIPTKARIVLNSCPLNKWTADKEEWERKVEEIAKELDTPKETD